MSNIDPQKFKKNLIEESRELVFLIIYLTLFLNSLSIYRSLLLKEDILNFFHLGYNFVEAILLAKIILLGEMFHLGEKYSKKALIIPTIYKAALFSVFIFIFTSLEHFVAGYFEGKHFHLLWTEFTHQNIMESLGRLHIAFLFLILLFSFLEISNYFGSERVFKLFFCRSKDSDTTPQL